MIDDRIYLSLGSNLGDRETNLEKALTRLLSVLSSLEVSGIYETQALYRTDQPAFLNMVVRGFGTFSWQVFLDETQTIEKELGRDRRTEERNGPRSIDIDILHFGNRTIHSKRLIVPHPGMMERQFVLIPLVEIEPELEHPEHHIRYSEVLRELPDQGVYLYRKADYNLLREKENASKQYPSI